MATNLGVFKEPSVPLCHVFKAKLCFKQTDNLQTEQRWFPFSSPVLLSWAEPSRTQPASEWAAVTSHDFGRPTTNTVSHFLPPGVSEWRQKTEDAVWWRSWSSLWCLHCSWCKSTWQMFTYEIMYKYKNIKDMAGPTPHCGSVWFHCSVEGSFTWIIPKINT